jgi:hypothetical protein
VDDLLEFLVVTPGMPPVRVHAANWISALGEGVKALGIDEPLKRLACEVLPNGAVIARNVATGTGFTVRQAPSKRDEPEVEVVDETDEETFIGEFLPEMVDLTEELEALSDLKKESVFRRLVDQIVTAPDASTAWRLALDVAHDLVPCESASALRREEDGALSFVGATGSHGSRVMSILVPKGAGIAGFCVENGTSLIVLDPATDPRFLAVMDQITGFATRSLLCVPVIFGDRRFGCLEVLNAPVGTQFTRAHLELLEMLADALSKRLAA